MGEVGEVECGDVGGNYGTRNAYYKWKRKRAAAAGAGECKNGESATQKLHPSPQPAQPGMLRTLVHLFGPAFAFGAFLKLCQDCLIFILPQVLK